MSVVKLADTSNSPMHSTPQDTAEKALAFAKEHPEYNKSFLILAKIDVIPGEDDVTDIEVFTSGLNDLEQSGLLASLYK